jgi:hypothetical protein
MPTQSKDTERRMVLAIQAKNRELYFTFYLIINRGMSLCNSGIVRIVNY